jgi:hypothetical protein
MNHSMILTPQLRSCSSGSQCYTPDGVSDSTCTQTCDGFPGVCTTRVCRNVCFPGCLHGDSENTHFCHPPKKRHFWEKPEKTRKNGFSENPSGGAQICGETRRIIYCLDTRCGPQTGVFPGPRKSGFLGGTSKTRVFAPRAKHVFLHTPCNTRARMWNIQMGMSDEVDGLQDRSKI